MAPKNEQLSAAEKAEIMGEGFSLTHQQEAQERYGKTDDWAEYQRRTASMDRADWQNGKQQVEEVEHALVEAFNRDVKPGSEEANALAERHRASLFFFEVTPRQARYSGSQLRCRSALQGALREARARACQVATGGHLRERSCARRRPGERDLGLSPPPG